jgi:hypothetical protein
MKRSKLEIGTKDPNVNVNLKGRTRPHRVKYQHHQFLKDED